VLTDRELAAIWNACDDSSGRIVRLMILTACRRQEIGGLKWSEIDTDRGSVTIDAARTKNHRSLTLTLPPAALAILASVPRRGEAVFSGDDAFQSWSALKARLDVVSGVSAWVFHDLRRSAATKMADLGVQPHVIEQILNHQSGHKRGPAGIYNRSSYDREVRAALALWGEHVLAIVEGRASKVVPLRA
jgi:integrase